jgi:multiple sugar transport system substrate-binding protein
MKKAAAFLLAGLMAVSAFSACGTKAAQQEQTSSVAASSSSGESTSLKAEITWWAFPTMAGDSGVSGQYEQSVIDAFNKKYPDIKVNLEMIDFQNGPEKIATSIQGGTAPDIIRGHGKLYKRS